MTVEVEEDQGLPPQSVSGSSLAEVAESSSPDAGGGPAGNDSQPAKTHAAVVKAPENGNRCPWNWLPIEDVAAVQATFASNERFPEQRVEDLCDYAAQSVLREGFSRARAKVRFCFLCQY